MRELRFIEKNKINLANMVKYSVNGVKYYFK